MRDYTSQEKIWTGIFGDNYTLRNPQTAEDTNNAFLKKYGISGTDICEEFIGNLDRSIKILEVGTNSASKLLLLQQMGFRNLYGIEINKKAIEISRRNAKDINIIYGSALDIPFKNNYFDLVFTAGVLIHISSYDIEQVLREIVRCSKEYIFGIEYFAEEYTEIEYRGNKNLLWKANFPELYLKFCSELRPVKLKKFEYIDNKNKDIAFLLKKKNKKIKI